MNETKPTNPKDLIGSDKIPIHLWPETATVLGSLALLDGALKYGRSNWRVAGVRWSIYYDAARRHLAALFEGEDVDPDSGLPHEAHILACMAIILDARAAGKLTDDRMVAGGYRALIDQYTGEVARLKIKHADRDPKHYTIADEVPFTVKGLNVWDVEGWCIRCKGSGIVYLETSDPGVGSGCPSCSGYGTRASYERRPAFETRKP